MQHWQQDLLSRLRASAAVLGVSAYGSCASPAEEVDGWSDLDVAIRLGADVSAGTLLGGRAWAWQETTEEEQVVRLVLTDGRRVDARVEGGRLGLPEPARDNAVRFDAALAASRLGRGSDLIGLHLLLGILREGLVQQMLLADRETGRRHHRAAHHHDASAREVTKLLTGPLAPSHVLAACDLYGCWRAGREPDYVADWSGVREVIRRGQAHPGR